MTQDPVQAQYEAYPYPERDPADEARRLVVGSPGNLAEVNHYVFAGRRDFAKPFRVLSAGGGTGDGTVMIASQLAEAGGAGQVVYVDLSKASLEICEARARARGLSNIQFHAMGLEAAGDFGPFDYIDCCGVLHHLEDPGAGLAALAGMLADGGGVGVMLYGELGRTGVYHMQDALAMLSAADESAPDRVKFAKTLLGQLPETNWLRRNPFVGDHLDGGDAGLFDLFLHARDRAYRVPEIAELCKGAGLRIAAFVEPARYDPGCYVNNPAVTKRLAALDETGRAALAELVAGNIRKHVFYAVRAGDPGPNVASPDDLDMIPVAPDLDGPGLAKSMKPGAAMTATIDGHTFRFPMPRLAAAMVSRIDGRRSLREVFGELRELDGSLDEDGFGKQFAQLYAALNGMGRLFLRADRE